MLLLFVGYTLGAALGLAAVALFPGESTSTVAGLAVVISGATGATTVYQLFTK